MDKLTELERRIEEYKEQSVAAEKMALQKLQAQPQPKHDLSSVDVLKRELLRHHTRTLLLNEVKEWIYEIRGSEIRMYELYSLTKSGELGTQVYSVRKYMTEKEAAELNAIYANNNQPLRWQATEIFADDYGDLSDMLDQLT